MSKAYKYHKITGAVLSLLIVAMSFFPTVYLSKNSSNVIQLLTKAMEEASVPVMVLCALLLAIPLLYAGCFIFYLTGKEAHAFSSVTSYIGILGTFAILGLAAYIGLVTETAAAVPITKWVLIRWALCVVEYINKRSGEEFFETMLKK